MIDTQADTQPTLLSALPAIYQAFEVEKGSNEPLHTLLGLVEQSFHPIDRILNNLTLYFDPATAPCHDKQNFLSWLASWVALPFMDEWSDAKKRFVLNQAPLLYQRRSTLVGLQYMVELFLNLNVCIKEWEWPVGMVLGQTSSIGLDTHIVDDPGIHHCFTVYWKTGAMVPDPQVVNCLHALLQREKPAHTWYYVQVDELPEESREVLTQLIIGESSAIGYFYIDHEERHGTNI